MPHANPAHRSRFGQRFSLPSLQRLSRSVVRPAVALAAAAFLPTLAHALQLLDVRDGVAVEAVLSIKEPTRIRIEGAPITDVVGSVQSSNCGANAGASMPPGSVGSTTPIATGGATGTTGAFNPAGEVILECDRDKGEVYVRPASMSSGKPINLFVASSLATYTLILRRADTPADTIVLRDRSVPSTKRLGSMGAGGGNRPLGPSANPIRSMKAMLVLMAQGGAGGEAEVTELNQPVQLWREAAFVLVRRYEDRNLVGEAYLLKNISSSPIVLAEQEFDRPDALDGGSVLGISVEHHNLLPGESTQVFVLRRKGSQESQP